MEKNKIFELCKDIEIIEEQIESFEEKKYLLSFRKKENKKRIESLENTKLYLLRKLERSFNIIK